ncbi:unnamed protein product [Ilex paraguariensis]|uniref:Uncharacterized protein n=1 Tax=Ilex paraguariensis TaxID=185542 RepID=A0ABC8TS15_9AQUA
MEEIVPKGVTMSLGFCDAMDFFAAGVVNCVVMHGFNDDEIYDFIDPSKACNSKCPMGTTKKVWKQKTPLEKGKEMVIDPAIAERSQEQNQENLYKCSTSSNVPHLTLLESPQQSQEEILAPTGNVVIQSSPTLKAPVNIATCKKFASLVVDLSK